jgi:hypothetical protein
MAITKADFDDLLPRIGGVDPGKMMELADWQSFVVEALMLKRAFQKMESMTTNEGRRADAELLTTSWDLIARLGGHIIHNYKVIANYKAISNN